RRFHDFRSDLSLPDWLAMDGPTQDAVIDPADGGLRIKLPAARRSYQPVGVATKLLFSGDFEITAGFELLSAARPAGGYGVGVSLNLSHTAERMLFGKIARFRRAQEDDVFISEF